MCNIERRLVDDMHVGISGWDTKSTTVNAIEE